MNGFDSDKNPTTGHILVVEDDLSVRVGMVYLLQEAGYRAHEAADGESALLLAPEIRPDLILMDIMMPGIDGFETTRQLKANKHTRDIPVIFLSALSQNADRARGFAVGAVDYITKPIHSEDVLARVKTHVTLRQLQKNLQEQNKRLEQEIIERKWVEEELRQSEARVMSILQSAVDGIITINADGVIESCNPAASEIFGYGTKELIGQNVKVLAPSPYRNQPEEQIKHLLQTSARQWIGTRQEVKAQRRDGSLFPIYLSVSESRVNDQQLFTGIIQDITEKKRAEEQRAKTFQDLQHYSKELQEKVARIQGEILKPKFDPRATADTISPEALRAEDSFQLLVVDDDRTIQILLTKLLSLQNYKIKTAYNGVEAWKLIQTHDFDLILTDIMMPEMDGYQLTEKIRQKYPATELPVILATAKNSIADLMKGFEVGANDYVTKPFSRNELLARIKTHIQLAKLNEAYGRFVPYEFLRFLGKESIVDVKLGDQTEQRMTILFSDIRLFTELSESMTPQENFNFLNSYLSRTSPIIRKHHGFIDKYVGDAIMALFPQSADDALNAAIEMKQHLSEYNTYRQSAGYRPISIGIGLHTGRLILGTIGEEKRMDTTVISDTVNLACRIEDLTKFYQTPIIISEKTLTELRQPEIYHYRFLDRVQVKGRQEAISVYEVFDGDSPDSIDQKQQTYDDFERGIIFYHTRKFDEATRFFQAVLDVNPVDKAALLYVKRCEYFRQHGVPEDWDGVQDCNRKT